MRSALVLAVATLAIWGSGCMKIHVDTVVEADGSGTATITYAMSREVADAVTRIAELDSTGRRGQQNLTAISDLERDDLVAACLAAGVELVSHELADDAAGVHLAVTLAFVQVADLSHALGALSSDVVARSGEELRITRTEAGEFLLANATIAGAAPAAAAADSAATIDPDQPPDPEFLMNFMVLLDHVGELDIRRTFTVPGEVISSNALEVEGRTSIWVINAANMLEDQDAGLDPRIVFAGEDLRIEAPQAP